jgi:hypothetical protein
MKYIKKYKIFESSSNIDEICNKYGIENYTINEDGSIDVEGNVNLNDRVVLSELPIKFGNVGGNFNCSGNKLTSLEGSPKSVGGNFNCSGNKLTSLEGSPKSVGGNFNCSRNKLTSLEGSPKSVGGGFYCSGNKLTSLEGSPKSVGGGFYCDDNQLVSLEGSPKSVGGGFYCDGNPVYELWKLFKDYSKVELFNDYDMIINDQIIIIRLNDFLESINKEPINKVKGYKSI